MILDVLFAHMIRRMFVMYFSIVRRSAAWASRERESASLMTTTACQRSEGESGAVPLSEYVEEVRVGVEL